MKGDSDGFATVALESGARRRRREGPQRADRLLGRIRKVQVRRRIFEAQGIFRLVDEELVLPVRQHRPVTIHQRREGEAQQALLSFVFCCLMK